MRHAVISTLLTCVALAEHLPAPLRSPRHRRDEHHASRLHAGLTREYRVAGATPSDAVFGYLVSPACSRTLTGPTARCMAPVTSPTRERSGSHVAT